MKKTTLICIHGFSFNKSIWDPQVQFFKDKLNVIAYDFRGHGTHNKPEPGPWMMAHFAEDLKKLMDEKQIDQAVICGLSMGGYIALHFVSQYPDRVQALILADTQAAADGNEAKDKRYATIEKLKKEGSAAFAKDFTKVVLAESTLMQKPELRQKVEEMIAANTAENMAMTVAAMAARKDHMDALAKITCPTLVIVGEQDKATPPEVNKKMADGIKGSVYKTIPEAGHIPTLEQPEAFNKTVNDFLNQSKLFTLE